MSSVVVNVYGERENVPGGVAIMALGCARPERLKTAGYQNRSPDACGVWLYDGANVTLTQGD